MPLDHSAGSTSTGPVGDPREDLTQLVSRAPPTPAQRQEWIVVQVRPPSSDTAAAPCPFA